MMVINALVVLALCLIVHVQANLGENLRKAGSIQQGDILKTMESLVQSLTQGKQGLNLPKEFFDAEGNLMKIDHTSKTENHMYNEKDRKLADTSSITTPTACTGDGATAVATIAAQSNSPELQWNFFSSPLLEGVTSITEAGTVTTSVTTAVTQGTLKACVYIKATLPDQSINDSGADKAITAGGDFQGTVTCKGCKATIKAIITYKMDCTLKPSSPAQSACTVTMIAGGGFNYNFEMVLDALKLTANVNNKLLFQGEKTQVFYDPTTTIRIYAKPKLTASLLGNIDSTGSASVSSSMSTTADMQSQITTGSSVTATAGMSAVVVVNMPTPTSSLVVSGDYDLSVSINPEIEWTISAGQMEAAVCFSTDNCWQATGATLQIVMSTPIQAIYQYKRVGTTSSSMATLKVATTLDSINAYVGVMYSYCVTNVGGLCASGYPTSKDEAVDYSKWLSTTTVQTGYYGRVIPIFQGNANTGASFTASSSASGTIALVSGGGGGGGTTATCEKGSGAPTTTGTCKICEKGFFGFGGSSPCTACKTGYTTTSTNTQGTSTGNFAACTLCATGYTGSTTTGTSGCTKKSSGGGGGTSNTKSTTTAEGGNGGAIAGAVIGAVVVFGCAFAYWIMRTDGGAAFAKKHGIPSSRNTASDAAKDAGIDNKGSTPNPVVQSKA